MIIYVRTARGQLAAYDKSSQLSRKQRSLLMAVNGKTRKSELARDLHAFGDVERQLSELHEQGYLTTANLEGVPEDDADMAVGPVTSDHSNPIRITARPTGLAELETADLTKLTDADIVGLVRRRSSQRSGGSNAGGAGSGGTGTRVHSDSSIGSKSSSGNGNYRKPASIAPPPTPAPTLRERALRPVDEQLESWKLNLVFDAATVLGADAEAVTQKIQRCQNASELRVAFKNARQIIGMYVDPRTAEKFAARHQHLG